VAIALTTQSTNWIRLHRVAWGIENVWHQRLDLRQLRPPAGCATTRYIGSRNGQATPRPCHHTTDFQSTFLCASSNIRFPLSKSSAIKISYGCVPPLPTFCPIAQAEAAACTPALSAGEAGEGLAAGPDLPFA
jgi:hypothetical protein